MIYFCIILCFELALVMKILNKHSLFLCSLGFVLVASMPVFAKSKDGTNVLIEKITNLNEDIREISNDQSRNYRDAVRSGTRSSSRTDVNNLNREFQEVLSQYKPSEMSWADFDPVKYYKIDTKDKEALTAFIDDTTDIKSTLEYLVSQMNQPDNERIVNKDTIIYDNSNGYNYNYRKYRKVYPQNYYYYYEYPQRYYYGYPQGYYYNNYYGRRPGVIGGVIDAIF